MSSSQPSRCVLKLRREQYPRDLIESLQMVSKPISDLGVSKDENIGFDGYIGDISMDIFT